MCLAVVTTKFVKVYDLSRDVICPTHFLCLPAEADVIRDACFFYDSSTASTYALVMAASGDIFVEQLPEITGEGKAIMQNRLAVPEGLRGSGNGGLFFSQTYQVCYAACACTCICVRHCILHLYLVSVAVPVSRTRTCTCTMVHRCAYSYLCLYYLHLYLRRHPYHQ